MSTTYLTQSLHIAVRQYPDRLATVCGLRRRSYGELVDRIARLAGALQQLGMGCGARVGILSKNSDRYLESNFAIWWGGGVVYPINNLLSETEITLSLDDCGIEILIIDESFASQAEILMQQSRSLRTIVYAGEGEVRTGMFEYENLISEHSPVCDELRSNSDLAVILYADSTTGFPKGVMLSHANLYISTLVVLKDIAHEGDIGLHVAPMFHLANGTFPLALTMRGCTQVFIPEFHPELVLQTIQSEQISNTLLVPATIQMLIDNSLISEYKVGSLRQISYSTSPISEALLDRAMQRLPGTRFIQAYGLTEISPEISLLGPEFHSTEGRRSGKLLSAGRPSPCTEVKIVDADGHEVAPGTVGEINLRGPGVMQGYWNKPEQTAEAIREGWVHTGNFAYIDTDGFLFMVNRVKEVSRQRC